MVSYQTLQALQMVKSGREFLSRRGAPLSSVRWGLRRWRALPVEAVALPQHPCTPALEQLLEDWDAAGFEMPSKPGQMIVHGRNGRVSSGGETTYMISQIRQAVWDCRHGNVPAVRERVALVAERLHQRS